LAGHPSYGASLKLLRGSRPTGEREREIQEARDLALAIGCSLRRSEERLDTALQRIDSTLLELAAQRERIQELERDLGIER
jgi:hypothetical protein